MMLALVRWRDCYNHFQSMTGEVGNYAVFDIGRIYFKANQSPQSCFGINKRESHEGTSISNTSVKMQYRRVSSPDEKRIVNPMMVYFKSNMERTSGGNYSRINYMSASCHPSLRRPLSVITLNLSILFAMHMSPEVNGFMEKMMR